MKQQGDMKTIKYKKERKKKTENKRKRKKDENKHKVIGKDDQV